MTVTDIELNSLALTPTAVNDTVVDHRSIDGSRPQMTPCRWSVVYECMYVCTSTSRDGCWGNVVNVNPVQSSNLVEIGASCACGTGVHIVLDVGDSVESVIT